MRKKIAGQMAGVSLDPMQKHSNIAPAILTFVKETLLQDSQYIARLKQHYQMMRKKFDASSGDAHSIVPAKLSKTERNRRAKQRERLLQETKRDKKEKRLQIQPLQQVKLAEVMEEMAGHILHSSFTGDAETVAILLASHAWNQANGAKLNAKTMYDSLAKYTRESPTLWSHLIDSDVEVLLDKLKDYKRTHYPNDDRVILGMSSQEHPDDPDAWKLVVASASKNEFEKWQRNPESLPPEEVNRLMATYRSPWRDR